jgi:hypothetical protein
MHRLLTMKRLSIIFLTLFAVLLGGVFTYDAVVVEPGKRCEARGQWWDGSTETCAQPISIAEITGRPIGQTRAEASAEKNRELVRIEDAIAANRRANAAETARQREALNKR